MIAAYPSPDPAAHKGHGAFIHLSILPGCGDLHQVSPGHVQLQRLQRHDLLPILHLGLPAFFQGHLAQLPFAYKDPGGIGLPALVLI